jgi:hypothetical protein
MLDEFARSHGAETAPSGVGLGCRVGLAVVGQEERAEHAVWLAQAVFRTREGVADAALAGVLAPKAVLPSTAVSWMVTNFLP